MIGLRLEIVLFLTVATVAGAVLVGGAGVRAAARPLRLLPLQLADVPAGFREITAFTFTNANEARTEGTTVSVIRKLGRLTGMQTEYGRTTSRGVCCITSQVSLWRSAVDARNAYSWHILVGRRTDAGYPGFRQMTYWHGRLSIQVLPCSCAGGTEGMVKLRTYKDRYYVFTRVQYMMRDARLSKILALAIHETRIVVSRVP